MRTCHGIGIGNRIARRCAATLLTAALASCDDGPAAPEAMSLAVAPASVALASIGDTAVFTATITDQYGDAFAGVVGWRTSRPSVFTVTDAGVVKAVGNGSGTLTASVAGLSATANVVVVQAPSAMDVTSGDGQAARQGLALAEAVVVEVTDAGGTPVEDVMVVFAPAAGDGSADPDTAATNADGRARTAWTLGDHPGMQSLTASVAGTGRPSVRVAATALTPEETADSVRIVSGDRQSVLQGRTLPNPVVVLVLDDAGEPVEGARVAFTPAQGDGSADPDTAATNADGRARTTWTLGDHAGAQRLAATVAVADGPSVQVAATALAPEEVAAALRIVSGDRQSVLQGQALPNPVVVLVLDDAGEPVEGARVAFTPEQGDGSADPDTAATNADGRARTTWTLGDHAGAQRLAATVAVAGGPSASAIATALTPEQTVATLSVAAGDQQRAIRGEPLPAPVVVQLLDSAGSPVANVEVSFATASGHGRADPRAAASNAQGRAQTSWTLGEPLGTQRMTASVAGGPSVDATATALRRPVNTPPVASEEIPTLILQTGAATVELAGNAYFRDADGDELRYTAVSSDPARARASVQGGEIAIRPVSRGTVRIVVSASDPSGEAVSQSFWAAVLPAPDNTGYDIDFLDFSGPARNLPKVVLDSNRRWERIITKDLQNISVWNQTYVGCRQRFAVFAELDDLAVFIYVADIDGPQKVLARAGPCLIRSADGLALVGFVEFDVADLDNDDLFSTALHEVGHVLGIGTLWTYKGLLVDPSSESNPNADTHFTGPAARAAFDAAGGTAYTGAKVPVHNGAGGGRNSHWRDSVFRGELMGPYLYPNSAQPLSAVTIQSLADLGYPVDPGQADSWTWSGRSFDLAAAIRRGEAIPLGAHVASGPILVVDDTGRIVREVRR